MKLSIDFGASNIRIAQVHKTKIINKKQIKTPKTKARIKKALFFLIEQYPHSSISIGVAAFIKNGITLATPNMDFSNVNLKKLLKERYKVPVYIDNDANCAGLGEKQFGLGKQHKNFVLLTLGTGVGGAIFIDNKLYRGLSFAGEPGHMLIDNKSLEELASAKASIVLAKQKGLNVTPLELESLAKKGDKKAISIYKQIGHDLGKGLLNIAYLLDPEIFILGGGFSKVKFIYKEASKVLHENDLVKRNIPVKHAKLGDNAGLIGAALLSEVP